MTLDFAAEPVPLKLDDTGTIRVGGTRVTLDTIIAFFRQGQSPEEINEGFPGVSLPDIYFVIGYVLRHQAEVDAYLAEQERDAEAVRWKIEANGD